MNVSILFAQNNPIFGGGNADGFDKTNFAQASSNIFNGGDGDGWNKTSFAQAVNNIFNGGNNDGWSSISFAQPINNIFTGGNGDGWNKTSFAQIGNNIFFGGAGDGWANTYRPMGPLPITLEYFAAKKNTPTSSILNWKTLQEINTASFDIESSNDAIGFKKIGNVLAAGNSNAAIEYSFIDNNPTKGINYYRLKQIDKNGSFVYTPTRFVIFDNLNAATVKYYPNPTNSILTIEMPTINANEIRVVNISNTAGAMVIQLKIPPTAGNKMQIDLSKYAKGIYFVQIKSTTLNSTERIILN